MTKSVAAAIASLMLAAIPTAAQTTAELLQKGIYAQETEGNLDNAILIYRQIVNSAPSQRDLAAQAQYRLAQALLQKGDLTTASKEFERLARDYADQSNLVSSLAAQLRPVPGGRSGGARGPAGAQAEAQQKLQDARQARVAELTARLAELRTTYNEGHPEVQRLEAQLQDLKKAAVNLSVEPEALTAQSRALFATKFDAAKSVTLMGSVSQVIWTNPRAWLKIQNTQGEWTLVLAAPNSLVGTGKMTRATLQPGMNVRITGVLANDGSQTVRADTISSEEPSGEVRVIFDRTWLPPAPQ
jgi:TolA-binding protein